MKNTIAAAIFSISMLSMSGCGSPGPRYENVRSYSEGLAAVQLNNGRWGFINENQSWVIPARFDDAKEFKNGKAAVKLNGKWGFINKRGEWM